MTTATTLRPAAAAQATVKHSTPQQSDPFNAAVDRASRWGVRVLATGRVKSTGQRFWIVSSASDAAHPHLCFFRLATGRISCDCKAGRSGRGNIVCQHVAAVVMHETVQADRRRRLAEEMEEAAREEREAEEESHLHAATRSLARTEAMLDEMDARDREGWMADNMSGSCIDALRGW